MTLRAGSRGGEAPQGSREVWGAAGPPTTAASPHPSQISVALFVQVQLVMSLRRTISSWLDDLEASHAPKWEI